MVKDEDREALIPSLSWFHHCDCVTASDVKCAFMDHEGLTVVVFVYWCAVLRAFACCTCAAEFTHTDVTRVPVQRLVVVAD